MRTWTITLPQSAPFSCTVAAFDKAEAITIAAETLGIAAVPCCEIGAEPCPRCKAYNAPDKPEDDARQWR